MEIFGGGLVGRRTDDGRELGRAGGGDAVGRCGVAGVLTRGELEDGGDAVGRCGVAGVITRGELDVGGGAEVCGGRDGIGWLPRMPSSTLRTTGTSEGPITRGVAADGGIVRMGSRLSNLTGSRVVAPGRLRRPGDSTARGELGWTSRPGGSILPDGA